MKNTIFIIVCVFSFSMFSQETISKDFNPEEIFEAVDEVILKDEIKNQKIIDNNKKALKKNKDKRERKLSRNWYNGDAFSPIIGFGNDFLIGSRLQVFFVYLDIKTNFGLWGRDKPSDYDRAFDDLDWITNDMQGYFLDSTTDESSATYILNLGYTIPILKSKNSYFSIFIGPGLAMVNEVKYDRYTEQYLNENYYHTTKKLKTNFNINLGVELKLRDTLGVLFGVDSYNSSMFVGVSIN